MQNQSNAPRSESSGVLPAILTFIVIVVLIMVIALLNAPTMSGAKVMASLSTYMSAVRQSAIPFLTVIGIAALILGGVAASIVRREWSNPIMRGNLIAATGSWRLTC